MATKKVSTTTQARVLVRSFINDAWVEPNDVIELTPEQVAEQAGNVDADPSAVAYALSLKSE